MLALIHRFHRFTTDNRFSEIFTGSLFALGARVLATGFSLVVSVLVARIYGAEAVGILAVVNSFLMLATIVAVFGTNTSILRLIPEFIVKYSVTSAFLLYRKIQYLVAGLSLALTVVFFFSAPFIAGKVFSKPQLAHFFVLASIFIVFKSLTELNTQAMRGLRLIRTFALMQILPSASMMIFLFLLTYLNRNQGNPVYAQLGALAAVAVVGIVVMDRTFKSRVSSGDVVECYSVGRILKLSTPMMMTSSIQFFNGQTGIILLGIMRNESEVGYFSVAFKLANLTSFMLLAINSMAAPKFSELYHSGKMEDLFYIARKSTKLMFWTTIPLLFVLIFAGRPVLGGLFGKEFIISYVPMLLLVAGQFVSSISGSTGVFMNMTGDHGKLRNIMLVAALINIFLGIILIPRIGINGAAIAGMTAQIFWNCYVLHHIKSKYGKTIGYLPI